MSGAPPLPTLLAIVLLAAAACGPAPQAEPDPLVEFGELAERLYADPDSFLSQTKVERLRAALAQTDLSVDQRLHWQRLLARRLLERGDEEEAVTLLEATLATAKETVGEPLAPCYRWLGLAYLRLAEVQNCVQRHNNACCLFPLQGEAIHTVREPAEGAKAAFEALLALRPDDLGARWLLNIAAMALGNYPANLAPHHRLPEAAYASDIAFPRFVDRAPALTVATVNLCGGVVADDFDGDQRLDILTSTYDPRGPMSLYRNLGPDGFADHSAASGVDRQWGGLNLVAADYDNDGDQDVLVLRGAWLHELGRIRNSLLRNDGGQFVDVTTATGLRAPAAPTQTAAFGDFDGDGWLDLYIGNESNRELGGPGDHPNQLFRNQADGTFLDVASAAGVTNDRYTKGVAVGDYDDDGDLDLYVSNVGPNRLYRNRGDGTFVDVAEELGLTEPAQRSFACWFFDHDNDGDLDLFVAAFGATIEDLAAEALGQPDNATRPRLYANQGDGTFADVARTVGLDRVLYPMGANFGDLDHDGWLDIYLTTGDPEYETLMPNVMLRNDRGRRFQDVTTAGGFGHLQKGHGVAFADFDEDGDQDIYHQLGGFYPGDRYANALFENPGFGNRYVYLYLVGTRCNRDAIGARLQVTVETAGGPQTFHRAVGSVSSFGGSPKRQELGLGQATAIARIEVHWPGDAVPQVFESPPLDQRLRLVQDQPDFEVLAEASPGD